MNGEQDGNSTIRASLLNLSSNKIREHINYMFALIAVFYTIYQINNELATRCILVPVLILFFNSGRIVYWMKFNSYIMTLKPYDVKKIPGFNEEIHQENILWGINVAAKYMIKQVKGYEQDKFNPINWIARVFSYGRMVMYALAGVALIYYFFIVFL